MSPEPPAVLVLFMLLRNGVGKNKNEKQSSSIIYMGERGQAVQVCHRYLEEAFLFIAHGLGERSPSLAPLSSSFLILFLGNIHIHTSLLFCY